ncbi:MAG: hypothetical protein ABIH57_01960, partial [Candidatus Omnitrophota bacterium]
YIEIKKALEKAIELNPHNSNYALALGKLELWDKNYKNASVIFGKALFSEANNATLQIYYAYSLLLEGVHEKNFETEDRLIRKGLLYYEIAKSHHVTFDGMINTKTHNYHVLKTAMEQKDIKLK